MLCRDKLPDELLQIVSRDNLLELVQMLDLEGTGHINETEFVEAIMQLASGHLSFERMQQLRLLTKISLEQVSNSTEMKVLYRKVKRVEGNTKHKARQGTE